LGTGVLIGWGTMSTALVELYVGSSIFWAVSGAESSGAGAPCSDGQWHFVVAVEDNGALDGIKRKNYFDGRMVSSSLNIGSITLKGASGFHVGSQPDGGSPFIGAIDNAFVCGYALTAEQIWALYLKGVQALPSSPKIPGDHIEAMSATDILATFDSLEGQSQIDLKVAA